MGFATIAKGQVCTVQGLLDGKNRETTQTSLHCILEGYGQSNRQFLEQQFLLGGKGIKVRFGGNIGAQRIRSPLYTPFFFDMARNKDAMVGDYQQRGRWRLALLWNMRMGQTFILNDLKSLLNNIILDNSTGNIPIWRLEKTGLFTVKSTYLTFLVGE